MSAWRCDQQFFVHARRSETGVALGALADLETTSPATGTAAGVALAMAIALLPERTETHETPLATATLVIVCTPIRGADGSLHTLRKPVPAGRVSRWQSCRALPARPGQYQWRGHSPRGLGNDATPRPAMRSSSSRAGGQALRPSSSPWPSGSWSPLPQRRSPMSSFPHPRPIILAATAGRTHLLL